MIIKYIYILLMYAFCARARTRDDCTGALMSHTDTSAGRRWYARRRRRRRPRQVSYYDDDYYYYYYY